MAKREALANYCRKLEEVRPDLKVTAGVCKMSWQGVASCKLWRKIAAQSEAEQMVAKAGRVKDWQALIHGLHCLVNFLQNDLVHGIIKRGPHL